jgi:pantothenate synthetase
LRAAQQRYASGERAVDALLKTAADVLAEDSQVKTQYLELVDAESLARPQRVQDDSVLAVAAFVGKTRLIDNVSMAE